MSSNYPTILVVQPALPEYRLSLFSALQRLLAEHTIQVLASNRDQNNVNSVRPRGVDFKYTITPDIRTLCGICWHPGAVKYICGLSRSDTLVLVGNPRFIFSLVAACIARLKGVEVIWWGQLWSISTTSRSLKIKIGLTDIVSDKVLLYTKQEARLLSRLRRSKKIYYLNNGIDNSLIFRLRVPYSAATRPRRILFLGRLTPKANIELLLRALPHTHQLELDIVGGAATPELHQLADSLNLGTRVVFHGETSDESRIAAIANQCLFFVYPGCVGLSLIHAFNYGLPALVHNQRRKHMPEIAAFKAGKHGETFAYQDYLSLAQTLNRMADNPDLLDTYSFNAQQVSSDDFNTDVMARRFAQAILSK